MYNLITITGVNHYLGMKAFKVGRVLRIVKEKENEYDDEAIYVELPIIGKVGYVANSTDTVYSGTQSAGRLYDSIGERAYVKAIVITRSSVIAEMISEQEYPVYDKMFALDGIDTEEEIGF